jgi:transcriptional regulator with XRE-family HTH domain
MKMKQPELGKKIAEMRRAKGLTQEELVEICNLSVRTLQRIESGAVEPRSHTLRVILAALDYHARDSVLPGARNLFQSVKEAFNFKTHTMRKISVLTLVLAGLVTGLLLISTEGKAQSASKVEEYIREAAPDFVRWFNNGDIDSLVTLYHEDACILGEGCGKNLIRAHYREQSGFLEFEEMIVTSVTVQRKLALEKGRWTVRLDHGAVLRGEYSTEWKRFGKKWLIVNDASTTY